MKRFQENESKDFDEYNSKGNKDNKNLKQEDISYKKLEEEEVKENFITPSMKIFRTVVGTLALLFVIYSSVLGGTGKVNYKSDIKSGKIEEVKVGEKLSKESVKLEAKDFSVETASGYGNIELSIWNFSDKEDGDYVQVFVDGTAQGEPFSIRHKAVKVGVPDNAVVQVKGIRDGSSNGITYGVFFNKTGETYLNTVPLNSTNTYTLKTN
ncbi:hypothetical protein NNC19_10260 [Clostridium sp. SHJSY1]|uniref:hypothetical protein n=1 Tax=Clostridium sp. SHJSY1 TaxID=2942483 RepID=UPI002875BF44|nr:hypothetical protein [Clostridium sp. SHJSY1]MDS0526063.1 hypothetical protein [Clostridium sp. SHJSY1]